MNPNAPFQPNAATRAGWPGRSSLRITNYAPRPVKVRVSPSRSDLSNPKPPPWPARRRSKPQRVPHPIQPELQSGPCIRKDLPRARRDRARHSVYAAPATSRRKFSPTSPSPPAAVQDLSQVSHPNFGVQVQSRVAVGSTFENTFQPGPSRILPQLWDSYFPIFRYLCVDQ